MIQRKVFYYKPEPIVLNKPQATLEGYQDWRVVGFSTIMLDDSVVEVYLLECDDPLEYSLSLGTAFSDVFDTTDWTKEP